MLLCKIFNIFWEHQFLFFARSPAITTNPDPQHWASHTFHGRPGRHPALLAHHQDRRGLPLVHQDRRGLPLVHLDRRDLPLVHLDRRGHPLVRRPWEDRLWVGSHRRGAESLLRGSSDNPINGFALRKYQYFLEKKEIMSFKNLQRNRGSQKVPYRYAPGTARYPECKNDNIMPL